MFHPFDPRHSINNGDDDVCHDDHGGSYGVNGLLPEIANFGRITGLFRPNNQNRAIIIKMELTIMIIIVFIIIMDFVDCGPERAFQNNIEYPRSISQIAYPVPPREGP